MGSWNQETGEATGLGAAAKWNASWNPFHLQRYLDPEGHARAQQDPEVVRAQKALQAQVDARPPATVDLTDERLMRAAQVQRTQSRIGKGLSSTFVTGQGVGR